MLMTALVAALSVVVAPLSAYAQLSPTSSAPIAPMFPWTDGNGVSLTGRSVTVALPSISVGDPKAGGLSYQPNAGVGKVFWGGSNLSGRMTIDGDCPIALSAILGYACATRGILAYQFGGISAKFVITNPATLTPTYDALTPSGGYPTPGNRHIYVGPDGTKYSFLVDDPENDAEPEHAPTYYISRVEKPDGEIIDWHYRYFTQPYPLLPKIRLQSVTNNLGYQIHFEYALNGSQGTAPQAGSWLALLRVVAIDTAVYNCDPLADSCSTSGGGVNWPYLQYGTQGSPTAPVYTVTDSLGRTASLAYTPVATYSPLSQTSSFKSPASSNEDVATTYYPGIAGFTAADMTLTNAAGTWSYQFRVDRTTVSGPNSYSREVIFTTAPSTSLYATLSQSLEIDYGEAVGYGFLFAERFVQSDTLNGRTTSYVYNDQLRIRQVTHPDGRVDEYEFNAHGAVTRVRTIAKPGSGLADINVYASYPETSAAMCANAKTCNKPLSVTDARNNVMDFLYDANHGGLLRATAPAPGSGPLAGVRPETNYVYSDNGTGIVRLASTSTCATAQTCPGSVNETVVETGYDSKRRPSSVTTRAGDSSISGQVATTYTPVGDVATVDGPASGAGDTSYMYYDAMRQLRASATPNPGNGSLPWRATKTTYDADGNPTRVEKGAVSTPAACSEGGGFCSGMADILRSDTTYDGFGRKVREDLVDVGSGQPALVTQYSYANGRLECVARRMNSAVYGSLPGACSQSTAGSFGSDRIVRTLYNTDGDVTTIQSGYGTSLARDERAMTYLQPGQIATLKDAKNNLTTYEYDGFNRLKRVRYPSPSTVNLSSATNGEDLVYNASGNTCTLSGGPGGDYDGVAYDAAGNKTCERRRDGQVIANTYDALNRLRFIDKPGSEPDVTNDYDTLRLVKAIDASRHVRWDYDALGRLTAEYQSELNATVSRQYDPGGHWTRLVWPGGSSVQYDNNDAGEATSVRETGVGSGPGVLATYTYDDAGRPTNIYRGSGGHTGLGYDASSRLNALAHDATAGGGATNQFFGFSYNPAGQITSRTVNNPAYMWSASGAYTDSYVANGLNQYVSARGFTISHDARGNTTNDGTKSYTYDSSNRITSASNGASLVYDPTGRILSISLSGTTTKFLYDGTKLIGEYNGSNALLRRYVHGPGTDQPIVWYGDATTNSRNWLYPDERGSIIGIEGPSAGGSGYKINKYDEYGVGDAGNLGRFSYTGQTWLSELGLHYYKARVYNPALGRFMQTDPIGTKDQINLYAYVGNDPVNATDPSGLDTVKIYDCDQANIPQWKGLPRYKGCHSITAVSDKNGDVTAYEFTGGGALRKIDFGKNGLKVEVDKNGHLTMKGARQLARETIKRSEGHPADVLTPDAHGTVFPEANDESTFNSTAKEIQRLIAENGGPSVKFLSPNSFPSYDLLFCNCGDVANILADAAGARGYGTSFIPKWQLRSEHQRFAWGPQPNLARWTFTVFDLNYD